MSEPRKCQAIKSTGGRCERIVHGDAMYCYSHDPARSETRKRAASKAARAKNSSNELVEIKQRLRQLSDDVASGKLATAKGSVAGQLLGIYIKAIEQERKIREQEDILARIEALERRQDFGYVPKRGGKW